MNGFLAGNKRLKKVTLSQNMLNNLDVLSQIFINKTMKEICIIEQSYFKTSSRVPLSNQQSSNQDQASKDGREEYTQWMNHKASK